MMRIECPWCGVRDQTEYRFGGEGHLMRPPDPDSISDEEWADYMFYRKNPKGVHYERWLHAHGCGQWFNIARNTVTHEILEVYGMSEKPRRDYESTNEQG
jgi:heterotetrameric sarcosine oxidase delta subunit